VVARCIIIGLQDNGGTPQGLRLERPTMAPARSRSTFPVTPAGVFAVPLLHRTIAVISPEALASGAPLAEPRGR
jgi:hypothetical protein